ncbi:MAG: hypothetical protein RIR10_2019 [Planctomycetota bacterium]|jgi:hypothetical protein
MLTLARMFAFVSAVGVLSAAGCNIVTPVAYAIEGPGQIDAEYTLPKKKTVIFVDDPRNILPRTALRTAIGDAVSFDLMERGHLESTVASRDAIAVARSGSAGNAQKLMTVEAVGKALDCAQVIHIQPTVFDLTGRTDDRGIRPTAIVQVKVLDLEMRVRTYPAAESMPDGREVTAIIREESSDGLRTRAGRTQIEDQLARKIALEVAQLFYQHERVDLGENLGTRRQ